VAPLNALATHTLGNISEYMSQRLGPSSSYTSLEYFQTTGTMNLFKYPFFISFKVNDRNSSSHIRIFNCGCLLRIRDVTALMCSRNNMFFDRLNLFIMLAHLSQNPR
jgi:hypothetical protein